jgi:protein-S-isoprenylcysteine O-methyltransferase Ste14
MSFASFKKLGNAEIGELAPIFELKGRAARIELSAWLAGLSFFIGFYLVGEKALVAMFEGSPLNYLMIAASFIIFLVSVLFIQGRMGFAVSANTFGKPNHLVTEGVFKYSRNPIYLAFWLPLMSLVLVSIPAAIFAFAFYVVSMNLTVLRAEERDLVALFGQTYKDYAEKVPRWIF